MTATLNYTLPWDGGGLLQLAAALMKGKPMEKSADADAFMRVVEQYEGIISKICYAYSEQASTYDDLRQDALINIWRGFDSFRGASSRSTWIYRVVLNTCVSTIRRESRHSSMQSLEALRHQESSHSSDASIADADLLRILIDSLSPSDKAILLLWLEERPYDEIAEIVGITRQNVASRLHRIRARLKKMADKI